MDPENKIEKFPHQFSVIYSTSNPDVPIAWELNVHGRNIGVAIDEDAEPGTYNAVLVFPSPEDLEAHNDVRFDKRLQGRLRDTKVDEGAIREIAEQIILNPIIQEA